MKWNEILIIWCFFQIGNAISYWLGADFGLVKQNFFFTGIFAIYLSGLQYVRGIRNARN